MKNKQKIVGILAATLNIIASLLYWYAQGKQGFDQVASDTASVLGNWFFLISLILWVVFVFFIIRNKK